MLMKRIAVVTLGLAVALLTGPAPAGDADAITIVAELVEDTGGIWYGNPYEFYGTFEATGAVADAGKAYVHAMGSLIVWGADGTLGFALTSSSGVGPYLQPGGTWTIAYASGTYAGLQGSGTYTSAWPIVDHPWTADLQGLELKLVGSVYYPDPDSDDGSDDSTSPTKPGKGKKKK
jgi:hypothetical protein